RALGLRPSPGMTRQGFARTRLVGLRRSLASAYHDRYGRTCPRDRAMETLYQTDESGEHLVGAHESQALSFAITSSGMGLALSLVGSAASRPAQTLVSWPSTASVSPLSSRCCIRKLDRLISTTVDSIVTTSPNTEGMMKRAPTSTTGMPTRSY